MLPTVLFIGFIVPPTHANYVRHIFYIINEILDPINGDVMHIVRLSTWQYTVNTKKNHNKTRLRNVENCLTLSKCTKIGNLVTKYKNMVMLQKEEKNPLKIRFCFQPGDKIVIYICVNPWALRLYHPSVLLSIYIYQHSSSTCIWIIVLSVDPIFQNTCFLSRFPC
jgi:hypothetical protein